jgi:hypothetical protein
MEGKDIRMDNKQPFTKSQEGWRIAALVTGFIVGLSLQEWGWMYHNNILQGVGMTIFLAPTLVMVIVRRRPPLPWRKGRVAAMIVMSLLAGCILYILGLSNHDYPLAGLSVIAYCTPLLLPWIIERRKIAREKERQASR